MPKPTLPDPPELTDALYEVPNALLRGWYLLDLRSRLWGEGPIADQDAGEQRSMIIYTLADIIHCAHQLGLDQGEMFARAMHHHVAELEDDVARRQEDERG